MASVQTQANDPQEQVKRTVKALERLVNTNAINIANEVISYPDPLGQFKAK